MMVVVIAVAVVTVMVVVMSFPFILFLRLQYTHREFYSMAESHVGRQLLQSPEVKDAGKLICNVSGMMYLYVEDIAVLKDGKNTSAASWGCQAVECSGNTTTYAICLSRLRRNVIDIVLRVIL